MFNRKDTPSDQSEKEDVMPQAEQEETVVKSKKKGTPPGWKPASQLPKLKARAGFSAKWSNPSKLSHRLAEGWVIMKKEDNVGPPIINMDVNNPGQLSNEIRYMDLVAIMLPNELKQARDEWLRNENKEAMKGVLRETDEKLKENGVETFIPKGQEGRIVIN